LIQIAAFPILAEANEDKYRSIRDYLANLTGIKLTESVDSVISMDLNHQTLAVGLKSIPRTHEFGIELENVLMKYYLMICALAPWFEEAYNAFLKSILSPISQTLISGILGPNRLSVSYLRQANRNANLEMKTIYEILEVQRLSVNRPVVVGHGANGLLAKAVPFSYGPWRFSFEAPKLEDSAIQTLLGEDESDRSRIVNFVSEGSLIADADGEAFTNNRIPGYGLPLGIPPTPFQTFCFVTAACGNDTRFDRICSDVMGDRKEYDKIWEKLGRERTTNTGAEEMDENLWRKVYELIDRLSA
jgi:hypothetical protein